MSARDTQRSRVYAAENAAFRGYPVASDRLADVESIERFVRDVWSRKRVAASFPSVARWQRAQLAGGGLLRGSLPTVKDGRGRRRAGATTSFITMPVWSRSKWVVLHELAHVITCREHPSAAGHGWEYCEVYLRLVRCVLGVEAHKQLKASFKAHRVRFRKPRKRQPLSPDQRQALAQRLALARTQRMAA